MCGSNWSGMNRCMLLLRGFNTRNGLCVSVNHVHICLSILGLVLGEKVEVFAQRAGEL